MTSKQVLFGVIFFSCVVFVFLDQVSIFCEQNENPFLRGMVDDCCCPVDTVDSQIDTIHSKLMHLCKRTFFKYFKINYMRECPFWVAEYLCSMTDGGGCGICTCDENEIPPKWKEEDVDPTRNPALTEWKDEEEDIWIYPDFNAPESSYINLELNPQRHTGFAGYEATRIWKMIYNENCFTNTKHTEHENENENQNTNVNTNTHHEKQNEKQLANKDDICFEERVFYRLLSGFHASVSLSIVENFKTSPTGQPAPSVAEFLRRFEGHPEWLKNVYFTFLFLLRATTHAAPFLSAYDYSTGLPGDDLLTKTQMKEFLEIPLCNGCIPTFNESEMFQSENANELKRQLRAKFRNISEIMDCVACESCKVQAKLNILGIGTALKILLADQDKRPAIIQNLQRNEIIALINALRKYATAIITIRKMEQRIANQKNTKFSTQALHINFSSFFFENKFIIIGITISVVGLIGVITIVWRNKNKNKNNKKAKDSKTALNRMKKVQ